MSRWRLHKLVYYCQAWTLAWHDRPLFWARIEAWSNGPVIPELYRCQTSNSNWSLVWPKGDPESLPLLDRKNIENVLRFYGPIDDQWLHDLVRAEPPWKWTRGDLPLNVRGARDIPQDLMRYYYSFLSLGAARQYAGAEQGPEPAGLFRWLERHGLPGPC